MEQLIQKAADAMVKRGFIVHRVPGAQEARELVRGGRVTLGPEGELKMRRGRIDRTKEEQ